MKIIIVFLILLNFNLYSLDIAYGLEDYAYLIDDHGKLIKKEFMFKKIELGFLYTKDKIFFQSNDYELYSYDRVKKKLKVINTDIFKIAKNENVGPTIFYDFGYSDDHLIFCTRPKYIIEELDRGAKTKILFEELFSTTQIWILNLKSNEFRNIEKGGFLYSPRVQNNIVAFGADGELILKYLENNKRYSFKSLLKSKFPQINLSKISLKNFGFMKSRIYIAMIDYKLGGKKILNIIGCSFKKGKFKFKIYEIPKSVKKYVELGNKLYEYDPQEDLYLLGNETNEFFICSKTKVEKIFSNLNGYAGLRIYRK